MKHTREQLDGMSDLEITKVIAKKLGMEIINQSDDAVMCGYAGMRSTVADRNYCNNWNDIMPLAVEYRIKISEDLGGGYISSPHIITRYEMGGVIYFCHQSPQRAIACCLIMVLEVKK